VSCRVYSHDGDVTFSVIGKSLKWPKCFQERRIATKWYITLCISSQIALDTDEKPAFLKGFAL